MHESGNVGCHMGGIALRQHCELRGAYEKTPYPRIVSKKGQRRNGINGRKRLSRNQSPPHTISPR